MHGFIHEFDQLPRASSLAERRGSIRPDRGARLLLAEPLIGIIRNPRSHRNRGRELELANRLNLLVETPRTREALCHTLIEFARRGIDYLVVDGGDGTVRDVITCGEEVFGDHWPTLVVLPKGKTNALAVDLGLPNVWSLGEALDAVAGGHTIERRPMVVTQQDCQAGTAGDGRVRGFILGAGVFTTASQGVQKAHRRGAFNSFAVGLISAWVVLQGMFAGNANPYRQGTRMSIRLGRQRRPLAHSGRGGTDRRFLTFISTLERFPLGLKPFGPVRPGLKLATIDFPLRRLMSMLPALLAGFHKPWLEEMGAHRADADEIELALEDRFILDGEYFPAGCYVLRQGQPLRFVVP